MRRLCAAALCLSIATAAFAQDAPVRVELPEGPEAGANRPFRIRVVGGADRVRAPGTPWALPVGERGDEFVLQVPSALSFPFDVTVERGGTTERVTVPATQISGDVAAVDAAFDPLRLGPDPELFAAMQEVAAASPRLDQGASALLLVLAGAEAALAVVLAFRRDRPWIRAAWLSALPAAAAVFLVAGSATAPLVATPLLVDGDGAVVYVRVDALRDGSGTLVLPRIATDSAAVIRFSSDDRSVEEVAAGVEVRLTLRAGESRVFGYACSHSKRLFVVGPPPATPGPATTSWLATQRLAPRMAWASAHPNARPASSDVRVLPGMEVVVDALPTK